MKVKDEMEFVEKILVKVRANNRLIIERMKKNTWEAHKKYTESMKIIWKDVLKKHITTPKKFEEMFDTEEWETHPASIEWENRLSELQKQIRDEFNVEIEHEECMVYADEFAGILWMRCFGEGDYETYFPEIEDAIKMTIKELEHKKNIS